MASLHYFGNCNKSNHNYGNTDDDISNNGKNHDDNDDGDHDYLFKQILGVCGKSLVWPDWLVTLMVVH